jgi:hypothetical protein
MAQIKIAAGLLVGDVGTVLRNESQVAGTATGINRVSIGIAGKQMQSKMPLTFRNISVHVAVTGSTFDVKNWKGQGSNDYALSVNAGQVSAAGSWHGVY